MSAPQATANKPTHTAVTAVRLRRSCSCGSCADCKTDKLRRRGTGTTQAGAVPRSVEHVLDSPGRSLDAGTRAFMESRFQHDFSKVRVHAGDDAAASAKSINARAYTAGRHVVFDRGGYAPDTEAGRKLLAHELAHFIQQRGDSDRRPTEIGRADDPAERQADDIADRALAGTASEGLTARSTSSMPPVLRRQEEGQEAKPDIAWIADEVYLGMKGLGTDEERVYRALERLKHNQAWIDEMRRSYARHGDLEADLDDDFDGTELEYALQLINKGDPKSPQAARTQRYGWEGLRGAARRLHEELDRFATDEEAVYALLLPLDHDPHLIFGLEMAFSGLTRGKQTLRSRLDEEMSGEELAHAMYLISIPYEWWVRRANEKLRATTFGIPWGSFCGPEPARDSVWPDAYDDRYWTQQEDKEFGCKLVLNNDVRPSVAIEALFEEQDRWNIDCGVFVQVAQWYAMLHVDGPNRFDQRMPRPVELRQEKSSGLEVESTFCRRDFNRPLMPCRPQGRDHVPVEKAKPADEADVLKSAPVGTRIVFSNPLVAEAQQHLQELPTDVLAYLNENSVKLGDDEYGAFPLRSGSRYVLSRDEVVDRMAERTYQSLSKSKEEVKAQIFISLIQITRPKGS